MTEQNPEQPTHQDPAEPKETGTETETSDQPDSGNEDADAPVPAESQPVEVSPEPTPTQQTGLKTDNVHGVDYEVSDDRGYRVKKD
jgi:hypothetical protein